MLKEIIGSPKCNIQRKKSSKNKTKRKTFPDKQKLQKKIIRVLNFFLTPWPLWHSGETYEHFLRVKFLKT